EVAKYRLLLPPPGTGLRAALDAAAHEAGAVLHAEAELDGARLPASMAFQGYGVAILPATAGPGSRPPGQRRAVALEGPRPRPRRTRPGPRSRGPRPTPGARGRRRRPRPGRAPARRRPPRPCGRGWRRRCRCPAR